MNKDSRAASVSRSRTPLILERNLNKTKNSEVSLSALSYLFSEILQYAQKKVSGIQDLEKMQVARFNINNEMLELQVWREKMTKRETKILGVLSFVHTTMWKAMFNKAADALEKSTENEDEYMLSDNEPIVSKFISVPKELSLLNCGAFVAGMIEAILDGYQFPCRVTAHSTATDAFPLRTTFLIKFDKNGKLFLGILM